MSEQTEDKEYLVYWVEDNKGGGIAEPFTLEKARAFAKQESGEFSSILCVRQQYEYTPEAIFYCGREYRPVEGE